MTRSTARTRLSLLLIGLAGLVLPHGAVGQEQVTLTLLHTTDLHGHVLPTEDFADVPAAHGLARIATLVAEVREQDPEALLLDAGDTIQGAPLELVAHTRMPDAPDPTVTAMNLIGYDAMTVGNHEFDFGTERLEAARRTADFPWLSANILQGGRPVFEPYDVFEVRGVRIGVLGITTPSVPEWLGPEILGNLEFVDAVTAAREWVPRLKTEERCDAIVLLVHQGLERDVRSGAMRPGQLPGENAAYALAEEVPGVDVILMGHTHRQIPFERVNGVLLTQAGRWGEALGRVTLTMTRDGEGWERADARGDLIRVTLETEPDRAILDAVAEHAAATDAYLEEVVAQATGRFDAKDGRLADNAVLDLIHEAQLDYTGADVSFTSLFRTGAAFGPGPVTVRDLAGVYVYENTLFTIELTGAQIREALEHSARYFRTYDYGASGASLVTPGIPGFNYDTAAGVEYEIDLTAPPGERIRDLRLFGNPIDPDRVLQVAVNSYRKSGGGGYTMFKNAPVVARSSTGMREILIEYARGKERLEPQVDSNWRLLPAYVAHPRRSAFERLVRFASLPPETVARLDPSTELSRVRYATWLGYVFSGGESGAGDLPFDDVPTQLRGDVARALDTGALRSVDGEMLRPLRPLDLYTALEWTASAASKGRVQDRDRASSGSGGGHGRANPPERPPVLDSIGKMPDYGTAELSGRTERFVVENGFLDEWDDASDPSHLTIADGAGVLAAATYPVVTVLHTSDFHGGIDLRHRDRDTDRPVGSSAVLAAYIDRERARNPRGTVLTSGGDIMQGTMTSNLSFGKPVVVQMNRLGYDAVAVGNHEFDWGVEVLRERIDEAAFPFLGANFTPRGKSSTVDWVEQRTMVRRRGVDVAVLGFCTVSTPTTTLPANVADYEFPDAPPIAQELVEDARGDGAEVVVLIGHIGASQDSLWGPASGELAELAEEVEGEDAVLGGHTHNVLLSRVGTTPVLIPSAHGRALGRVDFIVDRRTGRVVDSRAEVITVFADVVAPDPVVAAFVDSVETEVAAVAGEVLCEAPETMTRGRHSESAIGNWAADAILEVSGADAALQNPGGLRDEIPAGPVTVRDVYQVMPFDNVIAKVKITGAVLRDAVAHGVNRRGCVQVAGLRYTFTTDADDEKHLAELTFADGRAVDPEAEYVIAVNNFMTQGGDGYTMLRDAESIEVTSVLIRDALIRDCRARGKEGRTLTPNLDGRIAETSEAARTAKP